MGTQKQIEPIFYKSKIEVPQGVHVLDIYESALKELFFIDHPHIKKTNFESEDIISYRRKNKAEDVWIYYPWRNIVIHTIEETAYFKLRTARNKNILTHEEQMHYRDTKIGIIGLSIGSVILSSLVATGGPEYIKLADYDSIEITNLNRMNANLLDIDQNKAEVAAKKTLELDPFARLVVYTNKIESKDMAGFILDPKIDIFIDAMDSLDLKVQAREICRKYKIPCLMATSNGDSIIFDVERFDLEPRRELFHGRLGKISPKDFENQNKKEWLQKALKIVDVNLLTPKLIKSIPEVGKTISGVPQLATTLQLSGSAISYVVRRIANKEDLPSGRYLVNLDTTFAS